MKQAEQEIRNTIRKLMSQKEVGMFIGYERGTLPFRTSPCFVSSELDIEKLVWNSFCNNNLSVYLPDMMNNAGKEGNLKTGIICKGCDNRSLVELIKEKQVPRDQVYIIGMSCPGMLDHKKIQAQIRGNDIIDIEENKDKIIIKQMQGEKELKREDCLCHPCLYCTHPVPGVYDILIKTEMPARQNGKPDPTANNFAEKGRKQRWDAIEKELGRCIRCYACRNACPNCYCKECFAEQTNPRWCGVSNDLSDIVFYHMVRIFHQAGRCVDCGACLRACPMDIDLRLLTRMLVDEVKERFGYEPGVIQEQAQPFACYNTDDKQDFMVDLE